jgi:hypothetical protein
MTKHRGNPRPALEAAALAGAPLKLSAGMVAGLVGELARLEAERDRARAVADGLAERVKEQSDLLGRKAERRRCWKCLAGPEGDSA